MKLLCALLATSAITIPLRTREEIDPGKSAIVLCDLWDKHWCRGATQRVDELARRVDPFLKEARRRGFLIIHAPSETMEFYRDAPQRLAMLALPKTAPPPPVERSAPPLPIDDSAGGCDTPGDTAYKAWTRQHPGIEIAPGDLISDNGEEVYSALRARGITRLFLAGVHTNMCILNRSFAIRRMTSWGVRCVLLRDLTDAMYDPRQRPYVTHEQGTELVIGHIEQYWCPTVVSSDLLRSKRD